MVARSFPLLLALLLLAPSVRAQGRKQAPPADRLHAVAWTPDGEGLWIESDWAGIRRLDAATGAETLRLAGPVAGQGRTFLCLSPDGKRLAASAGGKVTVWDADTGKSVCAFQPAQYLVSWAAFAPDGASLLTPADHASGRAVDDLVLWGIPGGEERQRWTGHTTRVYGVAFDGRRALSCGAFGDSLRLWDGPGEQTPGVLMEGQARLPVFLPGGRAFAACEGEARVWELEPRKLVMRLATQGITHGVALSPDGRTLALGGPGSIRLWDLTSGAARVLADSQLATQPGQGPSGEVEALAFSPDGAKLAAGGYEAVVRIWDVAGRKELARFPASRPGTPPRAR